MFCRVRSATIVHPLRCGAHLSCDLGDGASPGQTLRRVSADEVGDHGAEPLARVLLEEMASSFDHRMN